MIQFLRQFSIKFRFIFIVAMVCISFAFILWLSYSTMQAKMLEGKQQALRNVVDSAHELVKHFHEQYRQGNLSEAEAQKRALSSIQHMRYGASRSEYLWVNNTGLIMLMHPLKPNLDGTSIADMQDPDGKYLFREMNKVVQSSGQGFVNYQWPRTANGEPLPKLSYVAGFEPWGWVIGSGIYIEDVAAEVRSLALSLLGALAVLLPIILGIIALLIQSITRPLKFTLMRMEQISSGDGDLTVQLRTDGKDELTTLAQSFNRFVDKIRSLVVNVNDSVQKLVDSVEGLSNATGHTAENIRNQQSQAELVATAINEMSSSAAEIARNADQASTNAHQASNEASNSRDIVVQTSRAVSSLAGNMQTSAKAINQLKKQTENIDNVLNVIQGIAEQTNLLALNAAIEAARAGEQGRGFAVVADEVRALASKTQMSTKEINDMIQQLQQGATEAVSAIEDSVEKSRTTVESTQQAEAALDTVSSAIQMINDMNAQIAVASEEQSAVSEEINRNVTTIARLTMDSSDATEEVVNIAQQVRSVGDTLRQQISRFRT